MFDFGILITILVTILLSYISLYFTFRHQLDEINENTEINEIFLKKERAIKNRIKFISIFTILISCLVIFLYFFPQVRLIPFDKIKFTYILKIFPFKKGFFSNTNFKISYITESILAIILVIIIGIYLYNKIDPVFCYEYLLFFIILIIICYGLIWLNTLISNILSYSIIHYFIFLCIMFNLLLYFTIYAILCFILN